MPHRPIWWRQLLYWSCVFLCGWFVSSWQMLTAQTVNIASVHMREMWRENAKSFLLCAPALGAFSANRRQELAHRSRNAHHERQNRDDYYTTLISEYLILSKWRETAWVSFSLYEFPKFSAMSLALSWLLKATRTQEVHISSHQYTHSLKIKTKYLNLFLKARQKKLKMESVIRKETHKCDHQQLGG